MTQLTYLEGKQTKSAERRVEADADRCSAIGEVDIVTSEADRQHASGDALAEQVSSLFEAYAQPVCAYIHSLVDDWQLAHDLTQETFLRLYDTRERLVGVQNTRAWVYRIATHVALNERKRRKRFTWLPWHQAHEAAQPNWSDWEARTNARDAVERALAALPFDYRAPLLLYSGYDFSVREIAEALEISEGAVKTRLHRAREMFRQVYDGSDV